MLTTMTCGRAQKLMPLYAAGDLAGWRARRVASHVEGCDSCRRLAAEFTETREWARAAAEPPEFGAEFYEGLRASVLDEIRRDGRPAGSRRAPFFDALSGRRLAYATSFALVLFAAALAFNFYTRRTTDAPQSPLANNAVDVRDAATPAPVSSPDAGERQPTPPTVQPRGGAGRGPQSKAQVAAGKLRRTLTLQASTSRATQGRGRELIAGASPQPSPRQVALAEAQLTKSGEVARIEIQTTDPNIRIIWLTPQEPDAPAPKR